MPRSRTIITLGALLAAMTVGTFALLALETTPAQPSVLAALAARPIASPLEKSVDAAILPSEAPLQVGRWTSIIVHGISGGPNSPCATGSHFFVDVADGAGNCTIAAGDLWAGQAPSSTRLVPDETFNAGAINICLAGDFSAAVPANEQMEALAKLVGELQGRLGIPADHVYLHRDLTGHVCPGRAFPVEEFRRRLR